MIVDFVSVKTKLYQALDNLVGEEVKKHAPLLGTINRNVIHEGDAPQYKNADHELKEMELQKAEACFSLSREEMAKLKFGDIIAHVRSCAADLAGQIERHMFKTLDREIPPANTIAAPVFSPETILQTLEKISIDFDDVRERPHMPSIVLPPEAMKKLIELEASQTEEEKSLFEAKKRTILDRKFQEYVERESKRRLVD